MDPRITRAALARRSREVVHTRQGSSSNSAEFSALRSKARRYLDAGHLPAAEETLHALLLLGDSHPLTLVSVATYLSMIGRTGDVKRVLDHVIVGAEGAGHADLHQACCRWRESLEEDSTDASV